MLIVEELFLIGLDEDSKKNELKSLSVLLAGAILHDLKHQKIISILPTDSLIKGPLIQLETSSTTGNLFIDEIVTTLNSAKKNFPIFYWLTKFKGKKYTKLIVNSLEASNSIKIIGKKYELIKPEIKTEITEKIVNCILHNQEPDEKLRNLLKNDIKQ